MIEETSDEQVDRAVIVVEVAVSDLDRDLGFDERQIFTVAQTNPAEALRKLLSGRRQCVCNILVERLGIAQTGEPRFEGAQRRRETGAYERKAFVQAGKIPIDRAELSDDLLELGGGDFVILDL